MKFKVGDNVAYSVQFLKSIFESHGELARLRGTVTAITPMGESGRELIHITWADGEAARVLDKNLAKVGLNTQFSNC